MGYGTAVLPSGQVFGAMAAVCPGIPEATPCPGMGRTPARKNVHDLLSEGTKNLYAKQPLCLSGDFLEIPSHVLCVCVRVCGYALLIKHLNFTFQ